MTYPLNKFYCFNKAISNKICNLILKETSYLNKEKGLIGDEKVDLLNNNQKIEHFQKIKQHRNSDVVFLSKTYIYQQVIPFVNFANKIAQWNYSFLYPETCQYTEYSGEQYYNWHQDCNDNPYDNSDKLARKLSCSILLNDPNEYDGGDLQFCWLDDEESGLKIKPTISSMNKYNIRQKGSIAIFPSFIHHRVTPVTRGTRKSLVIWFKGVPLI